MDQKYIIGITQNGNDANNGGVCSPDGPELYEIEDYGIPAGIEGFCIMGDDDGTGACQDTCTFIWNCVEPGGRCSGSVSYTVQQMCWACWQWGLCSGDYADVEYLNLNCGCTPDN